MASTIKIKRGLKTNLPILARGELGYATDTNELFIGVLAEPTQVSDNVLVSDLGALDNYFDKSEIEGLISTGLVWNDDEGVFSISIDFATGSEILDDEVNDKVMSPSTTAAMIDDRVGTTLTTGEYITESDLSEAIGALPGTGLDLEDGTLNVNTGTIFASPTFTGTVTIAAEGSLTGVPLPSNNADAASKLYVDEVLQGFKRRRALRAAAALNIASIYDNGTNNDGIGATITAATDVGITTIDGVSGWSVGEPFLVKNQTNKNENGIYVIEDLGETGVSPFVLRRCSQCDEAFEIIGSYTFIQGGNTYGSTGWVAVVDDPDSFVVGIDDINYIQFSGAGSFTAGTGLDLDGTVFSADFASKEEAETGTDETKVMNPARTKDAILELAPAPVIASKEEAEDGEINDKFMTPERVKQAIEVLSPAPTIATEQQAIEGTDNETFMTPLRTAQATAILDGGDWVTPVVNFTEIGVTNVKFTITNEEDFEVTVKYEVGDDTFPDENKSVVLAANATSDEIEIENLDQDTSYVLFAQSFVGSDAISVIVEYSFTTGISDDPTGSPGSLFFVEGAFAEPSEGFEELGPVGFFGAVSAEEFLGTDDWTDVMSELDISQGTAQFASGQDISPVLKFRHNNKIKFITQKTIRHSASWDDIHSALSAGSGNGVYGGKEIEINGITYKARLMRGWGQVAANANGTGTPNYETGPLHTISLATGTGGNSGVNWPTNTSGWSANNPNEWNTLIFPVASASQSQTSDVPNWASYSNADLQVVSGYGTATWTTENTTTSDRVIRGYTDLAGVDSGDSGFTQPPVGLRLVFERDIPGATKFFPAEV